MLRSTLLSLRARGALLIMIEVDCLSGKLAIFFMHGTIVSTNITYITETI